MALIEINDLEFTYPDSKTATLSGINLSIKQGEFIVLCGPSGCGKTTLLRHLKAELAPVGDRQGTILYRGLELLQHDPADLARQIGLVQQDPENQIVMEQVLQELAFGLENANMPLDIMRRRIAEMAHFFGLEGWLYRKTNALSGGQKQLMNLAALLLLQPDVLLLDEPTAQLDPVAAKEFLQMLLRLNEEFGLTVILTEHRLEELFPMADRVVMLDKQGRVKYSGTPQDVIHQVDQGKDSLYFDYLPSLAKLFLSVRAVQAADHASSSHGENRLLPHEIPLQVKEGRAYLQALMTARNQEGVILDARKRSEQEEEGNKKQEVENKSQEDAKKGREEAKKDQEESVERKLRIGLASGKRERLKPILECRELTFQYEKNSQPILRQLDLELYEGDFLAIVGGNGAGKSTLLQLMAGLLTPQRGSVRLHGTDMRKIKDQERYRSIGYLSQNPLAYFLHDTVGEEIRQAAAASRLPHVEELFAQLVALFELEPIFHLHPHDVSGGERQKAALACVLLGGPKLVLLDEPTKGLDPFVKQDWGRLLQKLHVEGVTIVMVTHDIEFAATVVERCAMLFDGVITAEGAPRPFFSDNYFYTTVINRLVRGHYPDALTYKDVMHRWVDPASSQ